jgi:hypothetical protein
VILSACGRVGFEETGPDAGKGDEPSPSLVCATCGDADGNGRFDVGDVSVVAAFLTGTGGVACPDAADSNLDGGVTRRDLNALVMRATGRASETCAPCTRRCGDLDDNGLVNGKDTVALDDILSDPDVLDGCVAWAADANGDGSLDGDDSAALDELVATGVARCAL